MAVVSGRFESFNRWLEPTEYGRIDESAPSITKIVSLNGSVLATLMPAPEGGEPDGAANGSHPFRSETSRTSSAAGFRR